MTTLFKSHPNDEVDSHTYQLLGKRGKLRIVSRENLDLFYPYLSRVVHLGRISQTDNFLQMEGIPDMTL